MSEKSDLLRKQTQECIDRCFDDIDALRAERDALRARIDNAPTTTHVYFNSQNAWVDCSVPTTWSGKRVALVPLDD